MTVLGSTKNKRAVKGSMLVAHDWVSQPEPGMYVLTLPEQRTDTQLEQFWRTVASANRSIDDDMRFGWIFDMSNVRRSSAKARSLMANHVREQHDFYRNHCIGLAVTAPSGVARGVVTAVSWLIPNKPAPLKIVPNVEAGIQWLERQRDSKP